MTRLIQDWGVVESIVGIVFDTTSANTGVRQGACTLVESTLGHPLLWLACRHHVYELHIKHVCQDVTGTTKEPGVKLFRRLKSEWHKLDINYDELSKFDWQMGDIFLTERAETVLAWGMECLRGKTFPRDDYRELVELLVVWLGVILNSHSNSLEQIITPDGWEKPSTT